MIDQLLTIYQGVHITHFNTSFALNVKPITNIYRIQVFNYFIDF